jgi:hypothetical protein
MATPNLFPDQLTAEGVAVSLASVRIPVVALLERSGVAARLGIEPTTDAAVATAAAEPQGGDER